MEAASADMGELNLLLAGALCVLALLWVWMSGRMGWHWFISAMVVISGLVLLVAATISVLSINDWLLFDSGGDIAEAALKMLALNAAVFSGLWLVVLLALRHWGVTARREV